MKMLSKTTDNGKCSWFLSLLLLNSLKLIVCLHVSDWYLLGVKLSLGHTHIGTFLGFSLNFPTSISALSKYGSPSGFKCGKLKCSNKYPK